MAVKITKAEENPKLVYDSVFLCSLSLTQKMVESSSLPPLYTVRLEYRLYAEDADGARYFMPKTNTIVIEDYFSEAMQKYSAGDPDMIIAMKAIEKAFARILEDKTDVGTVEVL